MKIEPIQPTEDETRASSSVIDTELVTEEVGQKPPDQLIPLSQVKPIPYAALEEFINISVSRDALIRQAEKRVLAFLPPFSTTEDVYCWLTVD